MPAPEPPPRVFYRAVGPAEYADWKSTGKLRASGTGAQFGKHLTTGKELARQWAVQFEEAGGEAGPHHILRVELPGNIALVYLGPRVDGIGPVYHAAFDQLDDAKISEVSNDT